MTGQRERPDPVRPRLGRTARKRRRARCSPASSAAQIGRLDLGVWAAREARNNGDTFYARAAFPEVPMPPAYAHHWALVHGIMRQESSFERTAVSPAGARGLMQLMPGTARETAGKLGLPYDASAG